MTTNALWAAAVKIQKKKKIRPGQSASVKIFPISKIYTIYTKVTSRQPQLVDIYPKLSWAWHSSVPACFPILYLYSYASPQYGIIHQTSTAMFEFMLAGLTPIFLSTLIVQITLIYINDDSQQG